MHISKDRRSHLPCYLPNALGTIDGHKLRRCYVLTKDVKQSHPREARLAVSVAQVFGLVVRELLMRRTCAKTLFWSTMTDI